MHDVCIVGAGPAGLSAALLLGRCGRDVVVFDSGRPRNGASRALHAYLTRDGVPPLELRALGVHELSQYPSIALRAGREIVDARRRDGGFELAASDGTGLMARTLLLATGRIDVVPQKPGFSEFYGRGVYHCPYCDGWENRDQPLVVHGSNVGACDLALELLIWSRRVTLCTDGPHELSEIHREKLRANAIPIVTDPIARLRPGADGRLGAVEFARHAPLECGALFFSSDCLQKSPLAENLGCELDAHGSVRCHGHAATNVPGLYVAGNVRGGIHLAIVAAAEGAEAAIAINEALHERSLR